MSDTGGIAAERLRSFIERVERLEEDRANLNADIREVYSEAKSAGFDARPCARSFVCESWSPMSARNRSTCLRSIATRLACDAAADP